MPKPSKADREKENRRRKRSGEEARKEAEEKSRKVMKKVFYHLSQFISVYLYLKLSHFICISIYFQKLASQVAKKGDKDYDPLASRVNQNRLASGRVERAAPSSAVPSLLKKRKKGVKETEHPSKRPQLEEEEKEEDNGGSGEENEDGGDGETEEEVLDDFDAVEEDNPPSTGKWVSFYLFLFLFTFISAGQWKRLAPAGEGQTWKSRLGPAKTQHQTVHRVRPDSRLAETTRSRPPGRKSNLQRLQKYGHRSPGRWRDWSLLLQDPKRKINLDKLR